MKPLMIPLLALIALGGCNQSTPPAAPTRTNQTPSNSHTPGDVRKDNTAVNDRDRSTAAKTPIDQNENQKDIDVTASIRKQVVNSDLSTNAKNSKIITQDGKVTLRGPVQSEDEKKKIEDIAIDVAGAGNVDNQLEVQP